MRGRIIKALLIVIACFSAMLMMAESITSKDPAGILRTALKNKKRLNYKLTALKRYPKLHLTTVEYFYNKANPDGTNYTKFKEYAKKGGIAGNDGLTIIKNADGLFYIHSGNVHKLNYEELVREFARKDLPTQREAATYKLKKTKLNGVSCYKISKKVEPDSAAFENYKDFFPDWYVRKNRDKLKAEFKEKFPILQIYYIDRWKLLPRKYEFYNMRAKKIYEYTYQKIKLLKEMDNKLFEIPVDSHIIICNNYDEYNDFSTEIVRKTLKDYTKTKVFKAAKERSKERKKRQEARRANQPGILTKIGSFINSHLNSISSIVSAVLFWLAIGLFVFVGVYKWKAKRSAK